MNLNLPDTESISKIKIENDFYIELTDEEISINGEISNFLEIEAKLALIEDNDFPIFLRIDENVKYKRIMHLFDMLESNNFTNIMLVSENK